MLQLVLISYKDERDYFLKPSSYNRPLLLLLDEYEMEKQRVPKFSKKFRQNVFHFQQMNIS